jgi:hypothetical protein
LGMAIAYLTSMLLLPALLQIFNPPAEPHPLGYAAMAPVDRFLRRHRMAVVVATILVVAAGLPRCRTCGSISTRSISVVPPRRRWRLTTN